MADKDAERPTLAIEVADEDGGKHVVGIGNLRVLLSDYGDSWLAQGLEVDYFAQGASRGEAKKNFEEGLRATIHDNLNDYGTIRGILRTAPPEIWDRFFESSPRYEFSQVSFHALGQPAGSRLDAPLPWFTGIDYYSQLAAA